METNQMVAKLREEAVGNPVRQDVLSMLACRKRSRTTLNVNALLQRMKKEGFTHTKEEYSQVLEWLSKIEIGKLVRTKRGHVKGLSDIKYTFGSLGETALGTKHPKNIKNRVKFSVIKAGRRTGKQIVTSPPSSYNPKTKNLKIVVGDRQIDITMPDSMSAVELLSFINNLGTN